MDQSLQLTANFSQTNNSVDKQSFSDGNGQDLLNSQELKLLIPAVLGIACVMGFAGNMMAVVVLVNNALKSKLTLINGLILNLAMADGLVLAFVAPFKGVSYIQAGWTLGWFVCKTCDGFLNSCMAAKSFTIAVMAKSCYRYVSNPGKQVNIRQKAVLTALLFTWLFGCLVSLPYWMFTTLRRDEDRMMCTQEVPESARDTIAVYVKLYPLMVFCGPLSFALLCFLASVWKVPATVQQDSEPPHPDPFPPNYGHAVQPHSHHGHPVDPAVGVQGLGVACPEKNGVPPPPPLFVLSSELLMLSISLINPLLVLSLSDEFRDGYSGLWRRFTLRKPLPKNKPSPPPADHTQVSLSSPRTSRAPPSSHGGPGAQPKPENSDPEPKPHTDDPDSPRNKDGSILPDLEQFWHERVTGSTSVENDPVPWEHQNEAEVKQQR